MDNKSVIFVKKAIKRWPAYRRFLEGKGVDPLKIESISELPVLDKQFIARAIHSIPLLKVRSIVPSSGSTGIDFSFGLFGEREIKRASDSIESFLQSRFDTKKRKTLILNLLPGAISLSSNTATVASIGVRIDTAIHTIKSLGSGFDQIILVGEPLFIKNLIEYGVRHSILWEYMPLFVVIGGEWIPESYRDYLEGIIGYQRVYSSMGMAELGLNHFYETEETISLRRLLFKDRSLLRMFLRDLKFCPMLFAYNEEEVYVETIKEAGNALESILLTTTEPSRVIPLIRYRTGDWGRKLSRVEVNDILKAEGYAGLLSTEGPPILAHFGRGIKTADIYPEEVKEIIYSSKEIASSTTGNFILDNIKDRVKLKIQLKKDVRINPGLENIYKTVFQKLQVVINLYPFGHFPCPLDFERKVRHINEGNNCEERGR